MFKYNNQKVIEHLNILHSKNIIIPLESLLDLAVLRSLFELGFLLVSPSTEYEWLLFLIKKAFEDGVLTTNDVAFQSMLYLLASHYNIKFEQAQFENLRQFSSIIKTKYGSYALDYLRGEKRTNQLIGYNIGLYSSRSIRTWDSKMEIYSGINLSYLLAYVEAEREENTIIKNGNVEQVLCNLVIDGFAINPGVEVEDNQIFGFYKRIIKKSETNQIINSLEYLKHEAFISAIEVFLLQDIIGNNMLPVGHNQCPINGIKTSTKVCEIKNALKALSFCYNCLLAVQAQKDDDSDWISRAELICSKSDQCCAACKEKKIVCRRLRIIAIIADQGDRNRESFDILRQDSEYNGSYFIHDL